MSLLNKDLEAKDNLLKSVLQVKVRFKSHQGWLMACPEENGSITPSVVIV